MLVQRTVQAVLLALSLLVALFLVSCKGSESAASSPTSPGGAVVAGTVVSGDAETGGAGVTLSGLTVKVLGGPTAMTDSAGNFTLTGVAAGSQQIQFSRGDISAVGTMSVAAGASSAILATITRRNTVVIGPRGNGNPNSPAQTQTAAALTQTPVPGTPTPGKTPPGQTVFEFEGLVLANSGGTLTIQDERVGIVVVIVTGTTDIRKGQKPIAVGDIQIGERAHVKATGDGTTFTALEITVQDTKTKTVTPLVNTATPTATGSPANTATPTNTPTATNTGASTNTPTHTNTPTMTPTPTNTPV